MAGHFQVNQTAADEPPSVDETWRALKSIAVASAAKISASMLGSGSLGNSRRPPAPPKAVPVDPNSIPDMMPPLKRPRRDPEPNQVPRLSREVQQAATNDLLNQLEAIDDSNKLVSYVKVPANLAGLIIGKGGGGIKAIQAESGVRLWVEDDHDDPAFKLCKLTGGEESAQATVRNIIERTVGRAEADHNTFKEELQVPEMYVPYIIGKDGRWIKRVKETTGCKVNVDKETARGTVNDRTLVLEGSHRAVKMGREQIELKILLLFRSNKVFNPELEEKYKGVDMQSACEPAAPKVEKVMGRSAPQPPPPPVVQEGSSSADTMGYPCMPAALAANPQIEVSTMNLHDEASMEYFKVLRQWASFYARDIQCVSYYTSIRSCAAQAYCRDAGTLGGAREPEFAPSCAW